MPVPDTARSPLRSALRRRRAVLWTIRHAWLATAARASASALAALQGAGAGDDPDEPDDPAERADRDYLAGALRLETIMLAAIRDARLSAAAEAYRMLTRHHGTEAASRAAYAALPAEIRTFGVDATSDEVNPLVFAMPLRPFPAQRRFLLTVVPQLDPCPHGRLSAHGECRHPPCPVPVPEPRRAD
jgi:hypothetical protein